MRFIYSVFRKDLAVPFKTFPLYTAYAIFTALAGYFFYSEIKYFSLMCYRLAAAPGSLSRGVNLASAVISTFFMNMGVFLLLLLPVVTMRSFAEEKKQGTLELLFTFPVSDAHIVLGKFVAAWITALAMTLPPLFFISLAGLAGANFDMGVLGSAYLGLFLLTGSFTALGLFTSALSSSPLVSIAVSFGTLIFLWMLGWGSEMTQGPWGVLLEHFSIFEHYRHFTKGFVQLSDIAYFALFTAFFLFMTKERIGMRRWSV